MAKRSILVLKSFFETGDKPTQAEFKDLIDSFIHIDDGVAIANIVTNGNGDVTFTFTNGDTITIPKYKLPNEMPVGFITGLQIALDSKVDKVTGKGLSTNDYDTAAVSEVAKVANKAEKVGDTAQTFKVANAVNGDEAVTKAQHDLKVDKVTGKGLSTNDYDAAAVAEVAKVVNKAEKVGDTAQTFKVANAVNGDEAVTKAQHDLKVDKVTGKGLSTNDYNAVSAAEVAKIVNKADSNAPTFTGDITLSGYTETRDDGVIPNNRVLGVDASGLVKLYKIPTISPPYLQDLILENSAPDSTGNVTLKGMGFKQDMTVLFEGQTINSIDVINGGLALVNATMGSLDGLFDITIDNGVSATFTDALFLTFGTVYEPTPADWLSVVEPIEFEGNDVETETYGSIGSAIWNKELDWTKDWELRFNVKASPLGIANVASYTPILEFLKVSDDTREFYITHVKTGSFVVSMWEQGNGGATGYISTLIGGGTISEAVDAFTATKNPIIKYISGILYFYDGATIRATCALTLTENMKLKVKSKQLDIIDIKYIELA